MMGDPKQYKNFFILFSEAREDFLFKVKDGMYEIDGDRVLLKYNDIPLNVRELNIIWESSKQEEVRKLDESGKIISISEISQEVNEVKVWVYDENPYIFVFTNKVTLLRGIQRILMELFNFNTKHVEFTNDFYNQLIKLDEVINISYQTNDENFSSITLTGKRSLLSSDIYNRIDIHKNRITELTILLNGHFRIKVYKNGKILIYSMPSIYEIFEIISDFKSLFSFGGLSFE
ncbi:hypothetical protein [Bacillus cereus]|uniref:hypothetical protein n=1 Tax=Bacillus cereus TaxID=1396 RepID=UPI000BF3A2A3|nr:hypothetical protein [Bacillus cereus]PEX85746.1 hypothetical protein CN450_16670 [Bacillus cereus]